MDVVPLLLLLLPAQEEMQNVARCRCFPEERKKQADVAVAGRQQTATQLLRS